ncbi:MAG TPA: hypothetical protein VK175_06235 [Leadbetterella sp.]|nr:hypothetical protein [Leadbetterella sp.]
MGEFLGWVLIYKLEGLRQAQPDNNDMRKLKNLELVGKTRLIPGVGHVTFEEDVPEHVAVACDAAGLDWCETGGLVIGELVTGDADGPDSYREVTGGLDTGDALRSLDKLGTGGAQGDNGGEDGNVGEDTNIGVSVKGVTRKRK